MPFLKKSIVDSRSTIVHRRAFTLIELLVVISIIAILVAAATTSWLNAQQKSRDGKRKSDLKSIQQALELYFQNNGRYPDTGTSNVIKCNVGQQDNIAWGGNFTCDSITYINPVPKDPVSARDHVYLYQATAVDPNTNFPLKYVLSAKLENEKDPDYCRNGDPTCMQKLACNPPANKNYCVINP